MAPIGFSRFDALTFDCYGTLIDWERGILNAFQLVLSRHDVAPSEDELLELFAGHEAAIEAGPYRTYREVLASSAYAVCADLGVEPTDRSIIEFGGWVTGRRFRIRPRRCGRSQRAFGSASSPTATTTCSRARAAGWAWTSTGS